MDSSVDYPATEATHSQQVGSGFDFVSSLSLEFLIQLLEYPDPIDIVRSQRGKRLLADHRMTVD